MPVISLPLVSHCTRGMGAPPTLLHVAFSLCLQLWRSCSAGLQIVLGGAALYIVQLWCGHGSRQAQDPLPRLLSYGRHLLR